MEKVVPLWTPHPDRGKNYKQLMKIIENKYSLKFDDYWHFHKWSVDHLTEFWTEVWDFAGVICSKRFRQVIDENISMEECPEWFEGAELNYAENILKYRDEKTALIVAGEDVETHRVSYKEVFEESSSYAASFRKLGLKKGDRVACYMSNRKEAVFAMLAAVSIGAIWTGVLPQMGSQAVLNRFSQLQPKFLLTVDRFSYNREEFQLLENIKKIADGLPSLEKVIIVPSKTTSKFKNIRKIRNSCFLDEFLRNGQNADGTVAPMQYEQLSFSHPMFINFTSGTTGLPKPLVHGIGMLLNIVKDYQIHCNTNRDSVWLTISPVGWVTWNLFTGLLQAGCSILLFEGFPYFLSPTSLWDIVDEFKISHLFLPASVVDELGKKKSVPNETHNLSSLKLFMAGGNIVKGSSYDYIYQILKGDVPFSSGYGSTETMGSPFLLQQTLPVYKEEINAIALGYKLECLNEKGVHVEGELGELVMSKPMPSLPLGLWGDVDGSKYKEKYYNKYPGKFLLGDYGRINPVTKGLVICGRSDDTLKQRGCRFGSSDIYNIVENFSEVKDSLCVSQYNDSLDERAVLFIKMEKGHNFNEELVEKIRESISKELTHRHVPDVIIQVEDIPYNMNGKKLEILVKNIINNKPYNAESVSNPESLNFYIDIKELKNF